MTLSTTRYPRRQLLLRTNEVTNPNFSVNATGWVLVGSFGSGGTGTEGRNAITWSPYGGFALQKQWSAGANASVNGVVGFRYPMTAPGGTGQQRTFSTRVITSFPAQIAITAKYKNASNAIISTTTGAAVTTDANTWGRPYVAATNPAGCTSIDFETSISGTFGAGVPSGALMTLQNALSETVANQLGTYFDGDIYAAGNGTQHTEWAGAAGASQSQLYDVNAADVIAPQLVIGYDVAQQSRNIVHQLADGPVAATLYPASNRQGTLKLFFLDADSADTARSAYAAATAWDYLDTDQPQETMRYVVDGQVRKYQDDRRLRWTVEVPYKEIG